ncbi:MAG: type II toxin-antitoxin system RelE family toxin [Candidatus Nanoarchaeia archaeon]
MYQIKIKKTASKFIQSLDIKRKNKLKEVFKLLEKSPFILPYKKLDENIYRIRVGNLRILYEVNEKEVIIEIIKVGNRENFYSK